MTFEQWYLKRHTEIDELRAALEEHWVAMDEKQETLKKQRQLVYRSTKRELWQRRVEMWTTSVPGAILFVLVGLWYLVVPLAVVVGVLQYRARDIVERMREEIVTLDEDLAAIELRGRQTQLAYLDRLDEMLQSAWREYHQPQTVQ